MKKKHTSSMMQPTNFTDFNPLDVLAAAASLQRRTDQTVDDSENDSQKTGSGSNNEEESKDGGEDEDGTEAVKCDSKLISPDTQDSSVSREEPARDVGKIKVPANGETLLVKKAGVEIVARNHSSDGKGNVVGVNRTVMTLGDASKMIIPTQKGNKALTVVRINKQQMTDHSYAFVCQLQNLKHEEDEGYSSRSSLDEEAEELVHQRNGHSGVSNIGGLVGRASTPTASFKTVPKSANETPRASEEASPSSSMQADLSRKPSKIVIMSKDSKLQRFLSGTNVVSSGSVTATTSSGCTLKSNGNAVLRTLLGQRPSIQTPQKGGNAKVVVAGNLSGRVINVLKSGSISLAPPSSKKQPQTTELLTFTPPRPQVKPKPCSPVADMETQQEAPPATLDLETDTGGTEPPSVEDSPITQYGEVPETIALAEQQQVVLEPNTEAPDDETDTVTGDDKARVDCDTPCLTTGTIDDNDDGQTTKQVAERTSSEDSQQEPSCGGTLHASNLEDHSPSEESSRHWSEASTEDETSCDSKGVIAVDTTPVMSPSTDYSSPLLSPVCERDVPMMSPMVESQSPCDIFRLQNVVKPHSSSSLSSHSSTKTVKDVDSEFIDGCCSINKVVSGGEVEETDKPSPLSTSGNDASMRECSVPVEDPGEAYASCEQQTDGALQTETNNSADAVGISDTQPADTNVQENQSESSDGLENEIETKDSGNDTVGVIQSISGEPSSDSAVTPLKEFMSEPSLQGDDKTDSMEQAATVDHIVDGVANSPKFTLPEGKNSKNQYIIEDDESPVTKFGPPRPISDEAPRTSCTSPFTLAISAAAANSSSIQLTEVDSQTISLPSNICVNGKPASSKEPMKVIVSTETGPRSLFTAVRRPLVAGMKALPGNLQVLPMVPSSKSPSGVMHVVPVSGARGVMTQIIPKSGGQIVTGVPVLGGKTVMLPDASKGRMSTLLVPVNVSAPSAASPASSISLVQNSKTKLLNVKQMDSRRMRAGSESDNVSSPKPQRKDVTSPLMFHGRITPVSSITSDTSDLLSSPENSLHGGFSGIIMGGRQTPDSVEHMKPGRFSLDNAKDKISFKISTNSLLDSDDSVSSESGFSGKKEIGIGSIGTMGSLSWKNIESSSRGLTPIGIGGSGGREFVRIQGGEVRTGIPLSDEDTMPPLETTNLKKGKGKLSDAATGKSIHAYSRKRKKVPEPIQSPPPSLDEINPQMARLHPLIDHDYCMFTEFNAQVQSSIIATTESKTKIEKKYAKKSKAVRTKAGRALITEESIKTSVKAAEDKPAGKGKRGRLKKRSASKDKVSTDDELSFDGIDEQLDQVSIPVETKPRKAEAKASRTSERRAKMQALKDDKNYVKITGSYQNDFVYFATKNKRNRPRKSLEDANAQSQKQPQVGGIAVFDWYKDLSRADKSSHFGTPTGSRFGTPTTSSPSSPAPYTAPESEVNTTLPEAPASGSLTTTTTSTAALPDALSNSFRHEATPIHESEVADLVCDLSEIDSLGSTSVPQVAPVNDVDLSPYLLGDQEVKSEPIPATSTSGENVSSTEELPSAYVDRMAEQVRSMLNSMGADELEKLELKLGSVETTPAGMTDTSFDGFLGGFTADNNASLAQPGTSNNLCDLDEINDSDLLRSDIGSMNTILGDVKSTVAAAATLKPSASAPSLLVEGQGERLPAPDPPAFGYSKTLEFGNVKLDKSELFPEVTSPTTPDVSALAADSAPELTMVHMYWNDLPGLVLLGQQYVRLVDIHKQVLPAKDTGILKKRCQMMGLPIANCSELQRDFLVRYANAAKSKSTVIVSKEAAQTLIGFYVEPKSRPSKQSSLDQAPSTPEQSRPQDGREKSSTPVTKPRAGASSAEGEKIVASPGIDSTPLDVKNRMGGKAVARKRRLTGGSLTDTSPGNKSSGVSPGNLDLKRSARLRHKKICYSDMLLGNHFENQEKEKSDELTAGEPIAISPEKAAPSDVMVSTVDRESESEVSDDHENKEIHKTYPEDLEIRRLKIKMRKKTLTLKEKRRLRRLRERSRKRDMKRRFRDKSKVDKICTKKKAAAVVAAAMMGLAKSKRKLQATHVFTKKYNQEHCYAAAPESPEKVKSEKEPEEQVPGATSPDETNQISPLKSEEISIKKEASDDGKMVPEASGVIPMAKVIHIKEEKSSLMKEKAAEKELTEPVPKTKERLAEEKSVPASPLPREPKRTPLAVLHRDAVHRLSQRSRWQDGELHTDLYSQLDSACIRCVTCSEFFTVKRFLKHMHHQNKRDELAHVTLSQTLELRDAEEVTEEEHSMWTEFKTRREELLSQKTPVARRSRSLSFKSAKIKAKQAESFLPKTVPKKELQITSPTPSTSVVNTLVTKDGDKLSTTPAPAVIPTPSRIVRQETPLSTRHSTRVRKRKQLHPIEKYVFSKASPTGEPQDKRQKLDTSFQEALNQAPPRGALASPPVRKVRMKLSSGDVKAAGPKYALRGPSDSSKH